MMSDHKLSADDKMWVDWYAQLKRIVKTKMSDGVREAIVDLNQVLEDTKEDFIRLDALAFRSTLWEELGEYSKAKNDLLESLGLRQFADFGCLVGEESLGLICERLNEKEEAREWYRKAMTTCLQARQPLSCGFALRRFLKLTPEESLTVEDRTLCESAVERSREVLGITPNSAESLTEAADRIIEAQGEPMRRPTGRR